MFINEYGNRNDPLIPLLALMMVTGEDLCRLMHPHFKHRYHFIRTQTLCQGGKHCDFRFVRHDTDAGSGWVRSKSI